MCTGRVHYTMQHERDRKFIMCAAPQENKWILLDCPLVNAVFCPTVAEAACIPGSNLPPEQGWSGGPSITVKMQRESPYKTLCDKGGLAPEVEAELKAILEEPPLMKGPKRRRLVA